MLKEQVQGLVSQRVNQDGQQTDTVRYLRPPGALPEPMFSDACSRCGACVQACPAQCIELDENVAGGQPYIVARQSPCVICDRLDCMNACPTGALKLVDLATDIRMGLAIVDPVRCLRNPATDARTPAGEDRGSDCRLCVDECPLGKAAIKLASDGGVQVQPGCVGCGVCERVCPTQPASIVVQPIHARGDQCVI